MNARETMDESELARIANALRGAAQDDGFGGISAQYARARGDGVRQEWTVDSIRAAIASGADPLGDALCRARPAPERRRSGAIYTPFEIVSAMLRWAQRCEAPLRVVDPGAGSGRFLLGAGEVFPKARLVAVETDPLAVSILRANAAVRGLAERLVVLEQDYRSVSLPRCDGATFFVGNPPYVRHHDIERCWKDWFVDAAAALGVKASRLAGLHAHFVIKTCGLAGPRDYGAFITAAEWLDVNYGSAVRAAFLEALGGESVELLAADVEAFPGTDASAAIMTFRVGAPRRAVRLRRVTSLAKLAPLSAGRRVERSQLARAERWSPRFRASKPAPPTGMPLGDLFRVHRGQVTGCNAVWIAGRAPCRLPERLLVRSVTRARELFAAGAALSCVSSLRQVVDLPADLDELDAAERAAVERFLEWAQRMGARDSYTARHRRAWWAVGLRAPAPLLCTYMARRAPAFVVNPLGARHINIAHGLYPRAPLPDDALLALAAWLRENVPAAEGRTYAGGLTKFEPKEVERLRLPPLEDLCEERHALDRR